MATNVTIKAKAWTDPRFDLLAELCGFTRDVALIRMAMLWGQCTDDETHVLSEAMIRGRLGARGVDNLLEADLGERVEGGIRIKGTGADTTDWLGVKRRAGSSGGKRRAANAEARRKQGPSRNQAEVRQDAGSAEAIPNPRDLDQDLVSKEGSLPRAREGFDRDAFKRLAVQILAEEAALLRGLRAEGVGQGSRPLPLGSGELDLVHTIAACAAAGEGVERAADDCRHVLEVMAAEARAQKTLKWFDGGRWKLDRVERVLARTVADVTGGGDLALRGKRRDRARELDQLADALEAAGR